MVLRAEMSPIPATCALGKEKNTLSSTVKPNKASALASARALMAGTQKHTPSGTLSFGGASYSVDSLVQLIQSLVDAMTSQETARANAKDALAQLRAVQATVGPVIRAYRRFLRATYGSVALTLADYGLAPEKERAPMTAEKKAAKAAKAKATREALGTKGPKQKKVAKEKLAAQAENPQAPQANPPKPSA